MKTEVECSRDERNLIIRACFKNIGNTHSDKLIIFNGCWMKGIKFSSDLLQHY